MTPDEMRAYCAAELARLDALERQLEAQINTVRGGRQAYRDMIAELARRAAEQEQGDGLVDAPNMG